MLMRHHKGFTLIELLVAVAIFAVLSALGWQVFDHLIKTKDRNQIHEQQLAQLQQAYQIIQKDMIQAVPITAYVAGEKQPALILENGRFNFTKTGVTDPLNQGKSPQERVEYQYRADEKKLYRLRYSNVHQDGQIQPESSVLLDDVEEYDLTLLNPEQLTAWPSSELENEKENYALLPRGLQLKFKIQEIDYEWYFSLINTDYIKDKKI